ncbi:AT-hook motif nuclear-localized protein 11-like [Silene latifolia]|uniref:AT-hook motif nuclear-localized protein 11-like n=1 Tax=Silene latifolia TaxID=37657 RepID=UPI003D76FEBE
MDRRESMPIPGTAPLYMQRGMMELPGAHAHAHSQGVSSLSNSGMPFQSNVMGNSSGPGLVFEPNQTGLPNGLGAGPASLQLSATPMRRKRGRPRKYGADGRAALALSSISAARQAGNASIEKRGRGRPPGSGRKQQQQQQQQPAPFGRMVSSSAGIGFTPHVITVTTGEDISAKMLAFAQKGGRAICILSANGAVSTATIRHPSNPNGGITYEGRFDILSMSGSFLLVANDPYRKQGGDLTISLAGSDGRVIGGVVAGMLIAATPIQVIVGSFIWTSPNTNQNSQKGREGGGDSQQYTIDGTRVGPQSSQPIQNQITSSTMGGWQTLDMRNSNVDIDLMRG